jgi:hypothetical protein
LRKYVASAQDLICVQRVRPSQRKDEDAGSSIVGASTPLVRGAGSNMVGASTTRVGDAVTRLVGTATTLARGGTIVGCALAGSVTTLAGGTSTTLVGADTTDSGVLLAPYLLYP